MKYYEFSPARMEYDGWATVINLVRDGFDVRVYEDCEGAALAVLNSDKKAEIASFEAAQAAAINLSAITATAAKKKLETSTAYCLEQQNLEYIRQRCLDELNFAFAAAIDELSGEVIPHAEGLSWADQEREAAAFAADVAAEAPLLRAIAAARGMEVADLAAKVQAKATLYRAASGALIGKRQALQDAIKAAESESELKQIDISFK